MSEKRYATPVESGGSPYDTVHGESVLRITVQKFNSATLELYASHTMTIPASEFDPELVGGLRQQFMAATRLFRNRHPERPQEDTRVTPPRS